MNNWDDVIVRNGRCYVFMTNIRNEHRKIFEQAIVETNSDVPLGENAVDIGGRLIENYFVAYKPIKMCDFSELWELFDKLKDNIE